MCETTSLTCIEPSSVREHSVTRSTRTNLDVVGLQELGPAIGTQLDRPVFGEREKSFVYRFKRSMREHRAHDVGYANQSNVWVSMTMKRGQKFAHDGLG